MKKLSAIILLCAVMLLSACENTKSTVLPESGRTTTAAQTSTMVEESDDPAPTTEERFEALLQKYPIVSELGGSFAQTSPADQISASFEAMNEQDRGVMEIDILLASDLGLLGSAEDQTHVTLSSFGESYRCLVESNTQSSGEAYTMLESDLYADGCYYYLYEYKDGKDDYTEQYKVPMTAERFDAFISGGGGSMGEIGESDIEQITALIEKAACSASGMTEEGGAVYYAMGFAAEDLNTLDLLKEFGVDVTDFLSEECMSEIAMAVKLTEEGTLEEVYLDLPLELAIGTEDFSLSMGVNVQILLSVRDFTDADKILPPADADRYTEMTESELYEYYGMENESDSAI